MKIVKIHYNWCQFSNGEESDGSWDTYEIGKIGVTNINKVIEGHIDGKVKTVRVHFENGNINEVSNLNEIFYQKKIINQ